MISRIIGYLIHEPGGRNKGFRFFFGGKFHLRYHKRGKKTFENIQLNGIGRQWNEVSAFGDDIAVRLGNQVMISLFIQGKIIFFPAIRPFPL